MAKYEIELSDDLARRFSREPDMPPFGEQDIDAERVAYNVAAFIYEHLRRMREQDTARIILRQQALDKAVMTAADGETSWNLHSRAEEILNYMLGGN